MHVQVFTTGGTIDKVYFDAKSAFSVGEPQIADILRNAGVEFTFDIEVVFQKDSLEISDRDRLVLAELIVASSAGRIIVTHGTDTMAETARVVIDALKAAESSPRTVIFVGSLAPARFKASDAEFNVGFAAAAVQTLDPGVYVAMNGRIFDPNNVRKDREHNRFVTADCTPAA